MKNMWMVMKMISSFFMVEKQEDGDENDEDEFVGVIVLKDMVMVIV